MPALPCFALRRVAATDAARRAGAVAAALALTLAAGCGTDPASTSSPTPSAPAAPTASTTPSLSPTASPTPTASPLPPGIDQVITINYRNKKVSGTPTRVKVKLNSTVQLVVTSDVADEVHVHGYDRAADIDPGDILRLQIKCTIPGVFEVELEKRKVPLIRLQVQ